MHDYYCLFLLLGANVTAAFKAQRQVQPHGPLVRVALTMFSQHGMFSL